MKELYCYYDEVFKDYLSDGIFLNKCYIIESISIEKESKNINKKKIVFFIKSKEEIEINFNITRDDIFFIKGFYEENKMCENFNKKHLNPFYNYWLSNLKKTSNEEFEEKLNQIMKNSSISLSVSLEEIKEIKKIYDEYKEKNQQEENFTFFEIAESVSILLEKIINATNKILNEISEGNRKNI
ncbi:hypothetical protein [Fusobacterium nucleatum]|uniref:hypothetical protein n=1 Tax=Fusobacterium nucleatum TaxID=851 RepID=UPI0030CC8584